MTDGAKITIRRQKKLFRQLRQLARPPEADKELAKANLVTTNDVANMSAVKKRV